MSKFIILYVSTRLIFGLVKKKWFPKKVEEKEVVKEEIKQEQTQAQEELKKEQEPPKKDDIEMF